MQTLLKMLLVAGLSISCAHAGLPERFAGEQASRLSQMTPFKLSDNLVVNKVSAIGPKLVYEAAVDLGGTIMSKEDKKQFLAGLKLGGCQAAANRLMMSKGISFVFKVKSSDGNFFELETGAASCGVDSNGRYAIPDAELGNFAKQAALNLPKKIDSITIMKDIRHDGNGRLTYEYAVPSKELNSINQAKFGEYVTQKICGDANFSVLMDGQVSIRMMYGEQETGRIIHSGEYVSAQKCKELASK